MSLLSDIIIKKPKTSFSNRSFLNMASHSPCVLYPIFQQYYPAGSRVDLRISNIVRTSPTKAPLFGRFRQDYHIFFCPFRLYSPAMRNDLTVMNLDNDRASLGDLQFPCLRVGGVANPSAAITVVKGSLFDYLGYGSKIDQGGSSTTSYCYLEAFPYMNYRAIVDEYYVNRQLTYIPLLTNNTWSNYSIATLDTHVKNYYDGSDDLTFSPTSNALYKLHGSMFLRHLGNDMYNSFLSKSAVDLSASYTRMDSSSGYITFEQVRTSSALTRFFERLIAAGGKYSDWLKVTSGTKTNMTLNKPEYIGSVSGYIDFDLVTSTAASGDAPLGSLAGRGSGGLSGKQHRVYVSEPGYLFVMYSFIPEIVYNNHWYANRAYRYLSDYYNPSLDRLGWQTVNLANTAGIMTGPNPLTEGSVSGYQPAWTDQISAVNESHGRLADTDDLAYWTLSTSLSTGTGSSVTPINYALPENCSLIFDANTVDNFFVMHNFSVSARQPKSKFTLPKTL